MSEKETKSTSFKTKTAALVIVGDEILSGRTQDINTQWIAQRLAGKGISMVEVRVVPDIEERIIEAVNKMRERADYVLTTGGIGPTHDDITAVSVGKALGRQVKRHEGAYQELLDYYGKQNLTHAREKMSMIPEGAELIKNPVSGAPGFMLENVYVLAGVPKIMQSMLNNILPLLEPGQVILSNTVMCTRPESELADALADLQNKYKGYIDIGSYPQFHAGQAGVSVVMRGTDKEKLVAVTKEVADFIKSLDEEAYVNDMEAPIGEQSED